MVGYSALVIIEIPLPNIQNKANYKSCSNSLLAECVIYTNQKKKKNSFVASQWLLIPRNDLDYIKDIASPPK